MAGKDQKLEKISKIAVKCNLLEIGVAYKKNEKHVWRYTFQQYVLKFLGHRAESLRLQLSGKKKTKSAEKRCNCIESRNEKTYPGECKDKQLRRSRQE